MAMSHTYSIVIIALIHQVVLICMMSTWFAVSKTAHNPSHVYNVLYLLAKWPSTLRVGKVRLTGGRISSEGFIEVYAGNESWYKMCGGLRLDEGDAICRQLGYTGIAASHYGPTEG